MGAVFGRWGFHACAWVQHVCLVLYCLAYTVTGAEALQTVVQSVCAQHGVASGCPDSFWIWCARLTHVITRDGGLQLPGLLAVRCLLCAGTHGPGAWDRPAAP